MHSIHDINSFDITGKGFDKKIEQMVRVCHQEPLIKVEKKIQIECTEIKLYVSLKSSWRPIWWEKLKKRSGYSEHTYSFMGGTDIVCDDYSDNWEILLKALMTETHYTRLAVYHTYNPKTRKKGGFIHGDFKNPYEERFVYNSKWVRQYQFDSNGPIF